MIQFAIAAFAGDDPRLARCNAHEAAACHDLAVDGLKAGTDPAATLGFAQKGCDLGDRPSCTMLGLVLAEGRLVPADRDRASILLEAGCTGADHAACRGLGILLQDG